MKNAIIRADSSSRIGIGHIMRCLTLAHQLFKKNYNVSFLCKKHRGNINDEIVKQGFNLIQLSAPVKLIDCKDEHQWIGTSQSDDANECIAKLDAIKYDLLIVDHYSIDNIWHKKLSPHAQNLVVIDDLANRQLYCDIMIDQTFSRQESDYKHLVPNHCKLLLGKNYMLLREEFLEHRSIAKVKRKKTKSLSHILISLGGTDPDNITEKLLNWLIEIKPKYKTLTVTVVISAQSIYAHQITSLIEKHHWISLSIAPKSMAKLMIQADIAIGTSGGTAWERCCLGLPTINIISAENQQQNTSALQKNQVIINLGWHSNITQKALSNALKVLINSSKHYMTMVEKAFQCCDGKGVKLVATEINSLNKTSSKDLKIQLEKAQKDDCETVFKWQRNPEIRKYLRNPEPVKRVEHECWFKSTLLTTSKRQLYMIKQEQKTLGLLRFDQVCRTDYSQFTSRNIDIKYNNNIELSWEISIIVAPEHQGKGVAKHALMCIPKIYRATDMFAEVQQTNMASQKTFINAGFHRLSETLFILPATNIEKLDHE